MRKTAAAASWRPIAYVAVDDEACRTLLRDSLQALGWTVREQASGFHVLASIADLIERDGAGTGPGLIIVDEISRGCAGATLACGLRDLGCTVPTVLVRHPWAPPVRASYGPGIHVVERAQAAATVAELVRPWSPISLTETAPSRARAMA